MKIDNMEPLEIRKYPDKVLRENSIDIEEITDKETELFEKMLFTMKRFIGIGLAAPQIGINKKLIVAEVEERTIKLANPEIVKFNGTDQMTEGCLSVPNFSAGIERSYEIIVKGLNEKGEAIYIETEGLLARVLQHEIDHLHGKLIIDYLPFKENPKRVI